MVALHIHCSDPFMYLYLLMPYDQLLLTETEDPLRKPSIWVKLRLLAEHSVPLHFAVSGCLESRYMAIKTLCCLQGHHTHTWLNSPNMWSQFTIKVCFLCSVFTTPLWLSLAFLTLGLIVCLFLLSGTVWPSIRRLWKGSPVEWGELQSTVQKSKILERVGETSRGLWGCCQMLSSSASGELECFMLHYIM